MSSVLRTVEGVQLRLCEWAQAPSGLRATMRRSLWVSRVSSCIPVGQQINVTRDSKKRRLNAVHGTSPTNVIAVGDRGLTLRFDGTSWVDMKPPTRKNLLTVLCRSDQEVYVAGGQGALFRWDGSKWEAIPTPEITISSLAIYRDVLYAASGKTGVYRMGPNGLDEFKKLILNRLRTIDDLLFGVGNRLVAQFDGTGWWGGNLSI